jgi:hypothetical protein
MSAVDIARSEATTPYARSANFGGFESAEARSAKVEATQFPAPSKWTWIASLALAMTNRSRTRLRVQDLQIPAT